MWKLLGVAASSTYLASGFLTKQTFTLANPMARSTSPETMALLFVGRSSSSSSTLTSHHTQNVHLNLQLSDLSSFVSNHKYLLVLYSTIIRLTVAVSDCPLPVTQVLSPIWILLDSLPSHATQQFMPLQRLTVDWLSLLDAKLTNR